QVRQRPPDRGEPGVRVDTLRSRRGRSAGRGRRLRRTGHRQTPHRDAGPFTRKLAHRTPSLRSVDPSLGAVGPVYPTVSRSTYLATTSTSRLTVSPTARDPSV